MEKLLNSDDVARLLGVTREYVQTLCRSGQIGYIKPGGHYRFTKEFVEEFIQKSTVEAEGCGKKGSVS